MNKKAVLNIADLQHLHVLDRGCNMQKVEHLYVELTLLYNIFHYLVLSAVTHEIHSLDLNVYCSLCSSF